MAITYSFTPSRSQKFLGLGQLFTNLLRYNYIDTDVSEATNAYRSWEVKLAHRMGALIRNDTLSIKTNLGTLPTTAFSVLLKKSEHTSDLWISALRVQLVQAGTMAVSSDGYVTPYQTGSDWIFRIETYNPVHPEIEYYTLDTDGDYQTFNALRSQSTALEWKHYTTNDTLTTSTTPLTVTGVQPLINILFGYVHRLDELGFKVNAGDEIITDAETGRNLDWQLEIEKLVDRIYRNLAPGDGHILNPFMHALYLDTPTGLLSKYNDSVFIDTNTTQAVFDVNGDAVPIRNLDVVRTDDYAITYSDTPIFSAHLFIDEYEHVILFNNRVSEEEDSFSIFDTFLGLRINSAELDFVRQEEANRKPHFPGFVLQGNDIIRNITSSVDTIGKYYDAARTFDEPKTAEYALALLGFNKKDYFDTIGSSDATQFNFWRGLIQAKGTNMTIDAFANYKKFTNAEVDEYWAYKVAEYGDARTRLFPEVKVDVADCIQKFTKLQFYNSSNSEYEALPLFTQIESNDDSRWFNIDDLNQDLSFRSEQIESVITDLETGYYELDNIFHNSDSEPAIYLRITVKDSNGATLSITDNLASTAEIIDATLIKVNSELTEPSNTTYEYVVKGNTWINQTKVAPVKLFNYLEDELIKEIGLWHPAIGIHAYEPLDIISSISSKDPAFYNTTGQTVNNPNYVTLKSWGKKEVGRVWWDTSNLGYIPYYDAKVFEDRNERHARWGNLAEWASVDIYEWVESDVPPSEYDSLAAQEEGHSDVDVSIRASGQAANRTYYARNREITVRPIAWSQSAVGGQFAHPAFGPVWQKIQSIDGALFLNAGRAEDFNLVAGNHFSAWKDDVPTGEVVLNSIGLVYKLGSSVDFSEPQVEASGILTGITVSEISSGRIGEIIGQLTMTTRLEQVDSTVYVQRLRLTSDTGEFEEIALVDWLPDSEDTQILQFSTMGIQITIERDPMTVVYSAPDLAEDIVTSWVDVYIREGIRYTSILPLPGTLFINDPNDEEYSTVDYGWRVWSVPTQDDLNTDLAFPHHKWQPYVGEEVSVTASVSVVENILNDTLTLRNGIPMKRYSWTWSDWTALEDVRIQKISDGETTLSFLRDEFISIDEELDMNRVTIYADGVLVNPKNYTLGTDDETGTDAIQLTQVATEGARVLFIYRAYEPTAEELAFDPDVDDDPAIQTSYKIDYQYTKIDVRNENGSIVGAKYYFWVENSTVVRPNKSMSLAQAKSILASGPSEYMIFEKLVDNLYDSVVIAGLSRYVTNNDAYKLRFATVETLRDDPEDLALRNVHTEWALMRKSQNSKIPTTLWEKLTDAAAGEDIGGNPLPAQVRVDYDERNSTRTRYGFRPGQILADTDLVRSTIKNTILNTSLEIKIGGQTISDYITALDFDEADEWFADADSARSTMDLIWSTARAKQINEIFFAVLEDALANNYEFSDIFKTSLISVYTTSTVAEQNEAELTDGIY